jgi:hypothetical protein
MLDLRYESTAQGKIEPQFDNSSLTDDVAPPGAPGAGKHSAHGTITRLEPLRLLAHTWSREGGDSGRSTRLPCSCLGSRSS